MRSHAVATRVVVGAMALLLLTGGIVLLANRGTVSPSGDLPAHLATTLAALPSNSRAAAANTVDLTISAPGHIVNVAALVLPHDLAVTTVAIPVNAIITGSTATKVNFPVTLEGRDRVMGFSIVRLGVKIRALKLDPMPASTAVTAVAPIVAGSAKDHQHDWSMTTLADPLNDAQGGVRYLATKSDTSLNSYVDAIAIDRNGNVVAVLSSRHFWYAATFVAQVADVLATGHGCHADLGVAGRSEQGGGVLVTKVVPYGAAFHANLKVGDIITKWNGAELDTWNQLVSTLYLTPAYTKASIVYYRRTTEHRANVSLTCPFKLVP